MMTWFWRIVVLVFASCLGSFLNVCIHRLPQEKSLVRPRSFCPHCKKTIAWYDNIPLLSYALLAGKCRSCRARISLRYPVVEALCAGLVFVLYLAFFERGYRFEFYQYSFFFCLLIVVSFIDIDYHAIPVYLCLLGITAGLFASAAKSIMLFKAGAFDFNSLPIIFSFKGLIFGLGFTYLFKLFGDVFVSVYLRLRKKESIEGEKESMGLGDIDFMGMVGAFMGAPAVIFVFFLAPFFAVGYTVVALLFKRTHLIPYLPYLSLATLVVFFWGDTILRFLF